MPIEKRNLPPARNSFMTRHSFHEEPFSPSPTHLAGKDNPSLHGWSGHTTENMQPSLNGTYSYSGIFQKPFHCKLAPNANLVSTLPKRQPALLSQTLQAVKIQSRWDASWLKHPPNENIGPLHHAENSALLTREICMNVCQLLPDSCLTWLSTT